MRITYIRNRIKYLGIHTSITWTRLNSQVSKNQKKQITLLHQTTKENPEANNHATFPILNPTIQSNMIFFLRRFFNPSIDWGRADWYTNIKDHWREDKD